MIRAALHLHSTWSDGEFTIPELREIFLAAGCRALCVVDHAESFTNASAADFAAECASLSDERMLLVPGLEFECTARMHIVGYGVTQRCDSTDPEEVIRHIAACDGVSVIAHPKSAMFDTIRQFRTLPDGIEAWNTKYDGRYAPRPETFALIRELRGRKPDLRAFYGTDLHWRHQFRELLLELNVAGAIAADSVLDALRNSAFTGVLGDLRLPPTAELPADLAKRFGRIHGRSRRFKEAMHKAKRLADSVGLRAPDALKAQIRRLF